MSRFKAELFLFAVALGAVLVIKLINYNVPSSAPLW